jgi:hypothetical protein
MAGWLRYTPIAALFGVSIVSADPAPPCHVQISSAPEDVATEIQEWVASEPRCARELDVRVERGAFGLHIIATDNSGHRRERVVPDAQSAAVLVVSWMADDSSDEPAATPADARVEAPPTVPEERLDETSSIRATSPIARPSAAHWFTLGMSLTDDGYGVRGQVDVLALGHWRIGLAGGWRQDAEDSPDRDTPMEPSSSLTDATAFGAYALSLGPFDVRLQAGIGVAVDSRHDMMDMRDNRTTVSPEIDAAALLGLRLGDYWGIVGGPLLDLVDDRHVPVELSAFLGVARRM